MTRSDHLSAEHLHSEGLGEKFIEYMRIGKILSNRMAGRTVITPQMSNEIVSMKLESNTLHLSRLSYPVG